MDYTKMSKLDLLKVLNRLKVDIPQYKERGEETKLKRAMKTRAMVKKLFCECDCCKHAQFKVTVDDKGFELERIIGVCNFDKCPYYKDFVQMANETEDNITNALKQMLLT